MSSLKDHAGYLFIDHRDSPGISPEEAAKVPGAISSGKGELFEADVKMCSHCERAILLNPARERPRGYCQKCNHYICDEPGCNIECNPIRKLLDQIQNTLVKTPTSHSDEQPLVVLA